MNQGINHSALAILAGLLLLVVGYAWLRFSNPTRSLNFDSGNSEVLPAAESAAGPISFRTFDVYYIDNSQGQISDGDCSLGLVSYERGPFWTDNLLETAVTKLITVEDEFLANESQYNPLYESDLTFLASRVRDDVAMVELRGWLRVETACQQTQAVTQLEETIKRIARTDEVELILNQRPIADGLRFVPVD